MDHIVSKNQTRIERSEATVVGEHDADWRTVLRRAITDPAELCRRLRLSTPVASTAAAERFGMLVPETLLPRIQPGNTDDPILRQVLPTSDELRPAEGFSDDPVGEADAIGPHGLLRRYPGRSLIITTGRCGVHCRYCFRRHALAAARGSPVTEGADPPIVDRRPEGRDRSRCALGRPQIADVGLSRLGDLQRHNATRALKHTREVILSGGDPLTLGDDELAEWMRRLAAIEPLRRLRIHTRMPVVVPQRVTGDLTRILRSSRLTVVLVVQANHPNELDARVGASLGRLVDAGLPVLSQSVLLRGVNDSFDALAGLFERLIDLRVMPYYLHQLDRVNGAAHFEVPVSEGRRLVVQLRERLPGYAVPRYVRQVADTPCKNPLDRPE